MDLAKHVVRQMEVWASQDHWPDRQPTWQVQEAGPL